jgi:hypothetical protein
MTSSVATQSTEEGNLVTIVILVLVIVLAPVLRQQLVGPDPAHDGRSTDESPHGDDGTQLELLRRPLRARYPL